MIIRRTPVNSPFGRMMDRMIEHATRDYYPFVEMENGEFGLAIDVEENDTTYTVKTNLPGVKPEDIEINLNDNVLTLTAETKEEHREESKRMLIQERRYGKFSRSVRFPVLVNSESVEADYHDGVLTISVPKAAEAAARRITVKTNGSK
jgi:HSP20 family protein